MSLKTLKAANFAVFEDVELEFVEGINVLIGPNGTGKTLLLKLLYSLCEFSRAESKEKAVEKLIGVFSPHEGKPGRLVRRGRGVARCEVRLSSTERGEIELYFSTKAQGPKDVEVKGFSSWRQEGPMESVYIPPRDMISLGVSLVHLHERRELSVEEVQLDLIKKLTLPPLRGAPDKKRARLAEHIQRIAKGKLDLKWDNFFFKGKMGYLEMNLLSDGVRKMAVLSRLIANGTLPQGSILFWDEPDASLNPKAMGDIAEVILELQREGVQVFLATHDYVFLREISLRSRGGDELSFIALFFEDGKLRFEVKPKLEELAHDPIEETLRALYLLELERLGI